MATQSAQERDANLSKMLKTQGRQMSRSYGNIKAFGSVGGVQFQPGDIVAERGKYGYAASIHSDYYKRVAQRYQNKGYSNFTASDAQKVSSSGIRSRSGKIRERTLRSILDPSGKMESSYQASRKQARRNVAAATQRAKINQAKTEQIKNTSNRFSNNNVIFKDNQAIDPKSEEGQQIEAILDRQRITEAANAEQSKMFWNMRNASTATEAMQIRQDAMKANPAVGTFNYIVDNKTGKVKSDSLSGVLGVAQTTRLDKDGFVSEGISSVFRTNKKGIPQSEIMPRQWLTDSGKSIGSITERSVNTPVQVYKTAPREYMLPSTMGMFGGIPDSGKLSFSDAKELGYMDNTQKAFDFLPTPIERPVKPSESIYNAFIKSSSNTMAGFTNLYEYGRSGFMSLVDPPKKGEIKVGRKPQLKSFYSTPVTNVESALWGSAIGTFTQKDYWSSGQGEKNFKKELAQVGRNFERNPWSAGASTILEGALYAPAAVPKTISSIFTGTIKATTKGSGKKGGSGMSGSYSPGLPYKTYGANKKIDYNKLFPGTSFSSNTVGLGSGKGFAQSTTAKGLFGGGSIPKGLFGGGSKGKTVSKGNKGKGSRVVQSGSMQLLMQTTQKQKSSFKSYPVMLGSGTRTFGKQLVKQKTKQKQLPQLLSQDIVFKKQQSQLPIMAQGFKQKKGLRLSDALLPGVRQVKGTKLKTVKPIRNRGWRAITPSWIKTPTTTRRTPKTVLIPPMFTGLGIFGGGGRGNPIQTSGKRSRKVYTSTAISSDINIKVLPGKFLRVSRDRSAFDQLDYVESATMASLGVPVKPKRRKKSVPKKKSKVRKRKRSNR